MNPRASALVWPSAFSVEQTYQNTPTPALHAGLAESSPGHSPILSPTFFASSIRIRLR